MSGSRSVPRRDNRTRRGGRPQHRRQRIDTMAKKHPKTSRNPCSAPVLRALKQEVNQKAGDLIENVLKPKHVQPPPTGRQLHYVTGITTKWLGSKLYSISVYASPGPNALSPSFEAK